MVVMLMSWLIYFTNTIWYIDYMINIKCQHVYHVFTIYKSMSSKQPRVFSSLLTSSDIEGEMKGECRPAMISRNSSAHEI